MAEGGANFAVSAVKSAPPQSACSSLKIVEHLLSVRNRQLIAGNWLLFQRDFDRRAVANRGAYGSGNTGEQVFGAE